MNKNLLDIGSAALRKAALNQEAKEFILFNPLMFKILKKAADRYIGGETLAETVVKVNTKNANNFKCSIEFFVYGKEWYLYVCNRLAEYPMNIFYALKDIVNKRIKIICLDDHGSLD